MSKFLDFDFQHKTALVRVDFNVPIQDGKVTDDTRIKAALPTIMKIVKDGGKVVLLSHWGRPIKEMAKKPELKREDFSLERVVAHLSALTHTKVIFIKDIEAADTKKEIDTATAGSIFLAENLRFHKEEEAGDAAFAKKLAALGDVYVNDAFGTAHRAHASTAIISNYFAPANKMAGMLMQREIAAAKKVLHNAARPFCAIIGGAKVSDKILIIENLLGKASDIIIGGGMAYTFFKAKGGHIGNSLCEDDRLKTARELMEKAERKGVRLHLPADSIIADRFAADATTHTAPSDEIPEGWMGLDIGPKAQEAFSTVIKNSKTVLWNGPMGVFEMEKFEEGTKAVGLALQAATKAGAYTLVGGGDSVAAVNKFKLSDDVSYVSTGGGALLEFFEGKELPGINAIS